MSLYHIAPGVLRVHFKMRSLFHEVRNMVAETNGVIDPDHGHCHDVANACDPCRAAFLFSARLCRCVIPWFCSGFALRSAPRLAIRNLVQGAGQSWQVEVGDVFFVSLVTADNALSAGVMMQTDSLCRPARPFVRCGAHSRLRMRNVEIEDVTDIRDVQSTCRNIRRHKEFQIARLEVRQVAVRSDWSRSPWIGAAEGRASVGFARRCRCVCGCRR